MSSVETAHLQTIFPSGAIFTAKGFEFLEPLTYESTLQIGAALKGFTRAAPWLWGDFLNRAAADLGSKAGDNSEAWSNAKAAILGDAADLDAQTLNEYRWVCRHYSLLRRHNRLSFSHHREALGAYADYDALDGALTPHATKAIDEVLIAALANVWSIADMREHIRNGKRKAQGPSSITTSIHRAWTQLTKGTDSLRAALKEQPIDKWTPAQRAAWKQDLAPIHDLWERL